MEGRRDSLSRFEIDSARCAMRGGAVTLGDSSDQVACGFLPPACPSKTTGVKRVTSVGHVVERPLLGLRIPQVLWSSSGPGFGPPGRGRRTAKSCFDRRYRNPKLQEARLFAGEIHTSGTVKAKTHNVTWHFMERGAGEDECHAPTATREAQRMPLGCRQEQDRDERTCSWTWRNIR